MLYAGYALYLELTADFAPWNLSRLTRMAALLAIPLLVASPYTNAVYHLMSVTTDRSGGDFTYATKHVMGPVQLLGGLLFPPVASPEGCFYLGLLSVYLIWLFFARSTGYREKIAVFCGAAAVVVLAFGYRSYPFTLIWNFVPVLGQMRVFARSTVVLVPIFAVAVHHGYALFTNQCFGQSRVALARGSTRAFAVMLLVQLGLYVARGRYADEYRTYLAPSMPSGSNELDFVLYGLMTAAFVLAVLHFDIPDRPGMRWLLLALSAGVVTMDLGNQGRFLWSDSLAVITARSEAPDPSRSSLSGPKPDQIASLARRAMHPTDYYGALQHYFAVDREHDQAGLSSKGPTRVPMENFYYASYNSFYSSVKDDSSMLNAILGAKKLFLHESADPQGPSELLHDSGRVESVLLAPRVDSFTGNSLSVTVQNSLPVSLSWIDNYDAGWSVSVDGSQRPLERLFGTFKSVRLEQPGTHSVVFTYRPVISVTAWMALGIGFLATLLILVPGRPRDWVYSDVMRRE
jgi:hypothetical protein